MSKRTNGRLLIVVVLFQNWQPFYFWHRAKRQQSRLALEIANAINTRASNKRAGARASERANNGQRASEGERALTFDVALVDRPLAFSRTRHRQLVLLVSRRALPQRRRRWRQWRRQVEERERQKINKVESNAKQRDAPPLLWKQNLKVFLAIGLWSANYANECGGANHQTRARRRASEGAV